MEDFGLAAIGPSGECAVLQVTGEVDVFTAPLLRERLRDLAGQGALHIIVDLRDVVFLDSTVLGALVGCLKRLRTDGGLLTLVISAERILRIFRITGLSRILPPHPTVPDAIAADPHWRQAVGSEAGAAEEWCRQHGLS